MIKRFHRILRIIGIVFLALVVLALIAGNVLMNQYDEGGTLAQLDEAQVPYLQKYVPFGEHQINSYRVGDPSKPKVLLIHGSPGHWVDWVNTYTDPQILEQFCLIGYDRAGFGETSMPASSTLEEQGDVAAAVMEAYCSTPNCFVVAGHSYGGGVVQQVLLDHGDQASLGIYVAGTLAPEMQQRKWYNYLASIPVFRWLIPKEMRSSNHEMMSLSSELEKQEGRHRDITDPIILIQGTEDVLVPYETVQYYKSMKPSGVEYVIVEGMNHFVPWTNPELIKNAILSAH